MREDLIVRRAEGAADIGTARALFLEYAAWLEIDLCFQGFPAELAGLPGAYAPPGGCLLLAEVDGRAGGCVAVRPLASDPSGRSCELKRMWVRPEFRARRAGRRLLETALAEAAALGYRRIVLDTLPARMPQAVSLYRSLGFTECGPYYDSPMEGSAYMERSLQQPHPACGAGSA